MWESVRKQNRISGRNKNVQKKNQKQDVYHDGASVECDVKMQMDENDLIWDNDMSNILNKSQDNEESIVE